MSRIRTDEARGAETAAQSARSVPPSLSNLTPAGIAAPQHGAGNRAVGALLQREVQWVAGAKVDVADKAERKEAAAIIRRIEKSYGIAVNSLKGVKAVRKSYSTSPKDVLKGVKVADFKMKELRALERGIAHYAPILGKKRAKSTRKGHKQEVTSASKVHQSITDDKLDDTTLGEYFADSRNFGMFSAGTDYTGVTGDNDKELEATVTHELAHGLMDYAAGDFLKTFPYWLDENTQSGTAGAEAPPTDYGDTNLNEDLAETVSLFFVDPDRLKNGDGTADGSPGNPCPLRYAWVAKMVKEWEPAKAEAGKSKHKAGAGKVPVK
jgi:hypothetical protein